MAVKDTATILLIRYEVYHLNDHKAF